MICREWPSGVHLEVEDVYHIPLFEVSLKLVSTDYDLPSPDHIARLLEYVDCVTFPLFPALMMRTLEINAPLVHRLLSSSLALQRSSHACDCEYLDKTFSSSLIHE